MMRAFLGILLGTTLLTAGCAQWAPTPDAATRAEAQVLSQQMATQRAGYAGAAALFQAEVTSKGHLKLWPSFTAVLRYQAPDQLVLNGYSDLGLPLFNYTSDGDTYSLTLPDAEAPINGRLDSRRDPTARLLGDLSHLLDGAIGINLSGAELRRTKDGDWQEKDGPRFRLHEGHLSHLSLNHSNGKTTTVRFTDFRTLGSAEAPYRINVELAQFKVNLDIQVMEWNLAPS